MENEFNEALEDQQPEVVEAEQPVYTPRPAYQIWAAWIGLPPDDCLWITRICSR